jgi:hypothetical protein
MRHTLLLLLLLLLSLTRISPSAVAFLQHPFFRYHL